MTALAPILALQDIVYRHPGQERLIEGVSLELEPSASLGLIGPNGAGKTTLFHLMVGLIPPVAGSVLHHGEPATRPRDFAAIRRQVGLLFQNADDQLFHPTVLEDVAFGPLNLGRTPDEALDAARRTLGSLGLSGLESRLNHKLSGGEKKLVSLATVLAMEPAALLLDEPTGGLDPQTRHRLIHILNELPQAKIIISHDWDFLDRTTTRTMALEEGNLNPDATARLHSHDHLHPFGHLPHSHGDG